jgi:hypothetical protein
LSIERNLVFVQSQEARAALLLSKEISSSYEVQKRSFEKNRIYSCRKKSRLRTQFESTALKEVEFTIVERNFVFVRSSETEARTKERQVVVA